MRSRPLAALVLAASCAWAAAPASAAKILIVGDSHTVGPFGQVLDASLRKSGHETAVFAVCGASAGWWLGPKRGKLSICYSLHDYGEKPENKQGAPDQPPPFAKELLADKPDVVVFALGANGPGGTPAAAEKLLALVPSGTKCVWFGPPPMPSELAEIGTLMNALPAAFSRANSSCTLVDSRAMKCPTAQDPDRLCVTANDAVKDHFYNQAGKDWGAAAAKLVLAAAPAAP